MRARNGESTGRPALINGPSAFAGGEPRQAGTTRIAVH
jgi:hypothetical protein